MNTALIYAGGLIAMFAGLCVLAEIARMCDRNKYVFLLVSLLCAGAFGLVALASLMSAVGALFWGLGFPGNVMMAGTFLVVSLVSSCFASWFFGSARLGRWDV